jgi:hypothetical protein
VLLSAAGVLAAVAGVVVLADRITSWADDGPVGSAQPHLTGPSPRLYACVALAQDADDYCGRAVLDWSRRKELTDADRLPAGGLVDQVRTAVAGPTSGYAEDIRRALSTAGFPGAIVRPARANDPAPDGSIVYAVDAGAACVIGYRDARGFGGGPNLVGTLPDGTCLPG